MTPVGTSLLLCFQVIGFPALIRSVQASLSSLASSVKSRKNSSCNTRYKIKTPQISTRVLSFDFFISMEPPIDLQDWEFLGESDRSPKIFDPIQDPGDCAITPNYFSLNLDPKPRQSEEEIDDVSVDSDNPSWVDPDSDSRYLEQSKGRLSFSGIKDTISFWSDESSDQPRSVVDDGEERGVEKEEEEEKDETLERDLGGDRERVWWRMPLEILKVWVVRARPLWSISIAAAIVGALMLGRRLYKMKQRANIIPIKLAISDKKVSQFMARATRLNEAFSVVKRAPLIRPSLPAAGVTSWPMASLR